MSDVPPTPDAAVSVEGLSAEVRRLRSANSRLRDVVAGKDELLASQDALISGQRAQLTNQGEVIRLMSDRSTTQNQLLETQDAVIDRLRAENSELTRRLSMDSSNSSLPRARIRRRPRPSAARQHLNLDPRIVA